VRKVAQPGDLWHTALERVVAHASEHRAALEPLLTSRHPSQVYQAVAEGLVVGVVVWFVARVPRKAGVVMAWWLMVYGVLRVVTEVWRLPDAQFAEGRPLGLSRGQWLSVGMFVLGALVLVIAVRRGGEKMGGWLRPAPLPAPVDTTSLPTAPSREARGGGA
jgi:prolipoprotein diacylglyceryltransferase